MDASANSDEVVSFLKDRGNAKQADRVIKRGIPAGHVLGVSKGVIQNTAKTLGTNQSIAEALWCSEFHEARLVAILIADPTTISEKTLTTWASELWSWDITDHLARYLIPYLPDASPLLRFCEASNDVYPQRLVYAAIACIVMKQDELSEDQIETYFECLHRGAADQRHHVRKAVVWALIEIGKVNESLQDAAIVCAAELIEQGGNHAWVGRNALKELELLIKVPERRRLLSSKAKTAASKSI